MIHHYLLGRKKRCLEGLLADVLNEELLEAVMELRTFKKECQIKSLKEIDSVFEHLLEGTLRRAGLPPR